MQLSLQPHWPVRISLPFDTDSQERSILSCLNILCMFVVFVYMPENAWQQKASAAGSCDLS